MNIKAITPEELFPDGPDHLKSKGTIVRKGTIGTALINANLINNPKVDIAEKQKAFIYLKSVAETLNKFGWNKLVQWRNPEIEKLFKPKLDK